MSYHSVVFHKPEAGGPVHCFSSCYHRTGRVNIEPGVEAVWEQGQRQPLSTFQAGLSRPLERKPMKEVLLAVARVISFIRMRTLSHQFFSRSFCQGMREHTPKKVTECAEAGNTWLGADIHSSLLENNREGHC